jgi:MSHA biogenesis protein MshQ
VTAYNNCASPGTTPNFGKESAAESVTLSLDNRVAPSGTNDCINGPCDGSVTGSVTLPWLDGAATASNVIYSEVGTMTLNATLASGSYLSSGLTATGTSATVGAFVPAYFDTEITAGQCGTFTYSGQPMTVVVTAKRVGGGTTVNYSNLAGCTVCSKDVTLQDPTATARFNGTNTIVAANFAKGLGTSTGVAYTLTPAPSAPAAITLRAIDSSVTPNVSSSGHTEAPTEIRSGRLRMSNAFGSEKLPLSVPLALEYYTVGGYWAPNIADNCTQLLTTPSGTATSAYPPTAYASNTASNACFGVCTNASTADTSGQAADYGGSLLVANPSGTMTATASVPTYPAVSAPRTDSTTFYQGGMSLSMGAPLVSGTYLTGSLGLTLVSPPWLQVGGANPTAKVSFGIYNQLGNSNKIIYRREVR